MTSKHPETVSNRSCSLRLGFETNCCRFFQRHAVRLKGNNMYSGRFTGRHMLLLCLVHPPSCGFFSYKQSKSWIDYIIPQYKRTLYMQWSADYLLNEQSGAYFGKTQALQSEVPLPPLCFRRVTHLHQQLLLSQPTPESSSLFVERPK